VPDRLRAGPCSGGMAATAEEGQVDPSSGGDAAGSRAGQEERAERCASGFVPAFGVLLLP
jgi:hypothetical protein